MTEFGNKADLRDSLLGISNGMLVDDMGDTLLHKACRDTHDTEKAYLIRTKYPSLQYKANNDGLRPIQVAIQVDNEHYLWRILWSNRHLFIKKGSRGRGLLHYGAQYNSENCVATILHRTFTEVNLQDDDGNTPAHIAAINNHQSILRKLRENEQYQPDIRNSLGETVEDILEKMQSENSSIQVSIALKEVDNVST